MLIPSTVKKLGIHEKILQTKEGFVVLVRFEIFEINGRIRGRVISMSKVEGEFKIRDSKDTNGQILLQGSCRSQRHCERGYFEKPIASPYLNFDFLTSQMTRAPSLS